MPTAAFEATLREALPVHSVGGLEKFPFSSYREFLEAVNSGRVELLTAYDPGAFLALATPGQKALHYALVLGVYFVGGASVVAAVVLRNAWLLIGAPLALIGMSLSIPLFMRFIGLWLNRILLLLVVYLWYQGVVMATILVSSYLVPNLLAHAARHYCRIVLVDAATTSEIVLVWLFQNGSLVPIARAQE